MEWVGLVILGIAALLSLWLAKDGALTSASLAFEPILAILALGFCVLFIALGDPRWPAWVSFGLSLIAALVVGIGARRLISDEPRAMGTDQAHEETAAGIAGAEIPLLLTAAAAMVLAALGATTIS